MTTPKEALRPFAACIFNDNGDITIDTSHLRTEDYMRAKSALASLQSEDAVERVELPLARAINDVLNAMVDAQEEMTTTRISARILGNDTVRAILATGLVPDEAAVRAARDRIARIIDPNAGWGVQLDSDYIDLRHEQAKNEERQRLALTNADTVIAEVLALLPDEAAVRADEREKMLDKVCESLVVLSRGDESIIGAARVALNNAAVFICGEDRAKRAIRSGGGE